MLSRPFSISLLSVMLAFGVASSAQSQSSQQQQQNQFGPRAGKQAQQATAAEIVGTFGDWKIQCEASKEGGDGKSSCGYRLHAQFEVFKGTPSRIDVTGANPKGEADERRVLERTVEAGRCYLIDRGYAKYVLWNAIAAADSQYVCRLGDAIPYEVVRENALTDTDRSASIVSDQIVQFGTANSRTTPPDHSTRLVIVKVKPHDSRRSKNGVSGASSDGYLRIVTNNLDVPAEIIAALYELRWTIELYFRIIKQLLGCRHLLSTKANGVTIQIYMAIIACIMILAMTGKLPTKRTYEMICFYLLGLAELDELEAHIQQLPPK